jgi:hypothetical protein
MKKYRCKTENLGEKKREEGRKEGRKEGDILV